MDSDARESSDKAEFRKPSNDAANRKYRRRSPVGGSSSPLDGSPRRDHSLSPVPSRKDTKKFVDDKRKRDDGRNVTRRSGDSYKQSDRQSSRGYSRHDEHNRRDRYADDYDRGYSKSSYRSSRDPRGSNLDYSRSDKERRSRDHVSDVDTYSHARSDGLAHRSKDKDSYRRHKDDREGHRKSYGDHKGDRSPSYEEPRAQRSDSSSRRDTSSHRLKEISLSDTKKMDADDESREAGEISDETSNKSQASVAKKPKVFGVDNMNPGQDGTSEKATLKDSDIASANIVAMRAAEIINKDIVGTGYMSADQKKKLLWGSKKNTATEELAHRWDATTFGDRERQEKFNKLMGVKGEPKVENKQDNPDTEKQREQLQMELERQYTAGLRRRDGRTVGLGL